MYYLTIICNVADIVIWNRIVILAKAIRKYIKPSIENVSICVILTKTNSTIININQLLYETVSYGWRTLK